MTPRERALFRRVLRRVRRRRERATEWHPSFPEFAKVRQQGWDAALAAIRQELAREGAR